MRGYGRQFCPTSAHSFSYLANYLLLIIGLSEQGVAHVFRDAFDVFSDGAFPCALRGDLALCHDVPLFLLVTKYRFD